MELVDGRYSGFTRQGGGDHRGHRRAILAWPGVLAGKGARRDGGSHQLAPPRHAATPGPVHPGPLLEIAELTACWHRWPRPRKDCCRP